jgi:hypothetical protein
MYTITISDDGLNTPTQYTMFHKYKEVLHAYSFKLTRL